MTITIKISTPKKLIKGYKASKMTLAKMLSRCGAKLEYTAQKLAKGAK